MLDGAGVAAGRRRFERSVDARYRAAVVEFAVMQSRPIRSTDATLAKIAEDFHQRHRATYGHDNRAEPVQIVSVRVAAIGAIPPLAVRDVPAQPGADARKAPAAGSGSATPARSTRRSTTADGCRPELDADRRQP